MIESNHCCPNDCLLLFCQDCDFNCINPSTLCSYLKTFYLPSDFFNSVLRPIEKKKKNQFLENFYKMCGNNLGNMQDFGSVNI